MACKLLLAMLLKFRYEYMLLNNHQFAVKLKLDIAKAEITWKNIF